MPLTDNENSFLRLLMRSPDRGDGWREVSRTCRPLVDSFAHQELIEKKTNEDGSGMVRLSDRGSVLVDYL
jgi:hypothetical protein